MASAAEALADMAAEVLEKEGGLSEVVVVGKGAATARCRRWQGCYGFSRMQPSAARMAMEKKSKDGRDKRREEMSDASACAWNRFFFFCSFCRWGVRWGRGKRGEKKGTPLSQEHAYFILFFVGCLTILIIFYFFFC